MSGAPKSKEFDYEKALKQLEEIVAKLEDEDTPLETSIQLFTEGKKLADICLEKLTELEQKVQLLLENDKGQIRTEDLPHSGATPIDQDTEVPVDEE